MRTPVCMHIRAPTHGSTTPQQPSTLPSSPAIFLSLAKARSLGMSPSGVMVPPLVAPLALPAVSSGAVIDSSAAVTHMTAARHSSTGNSQGAPQQRRQPQQQYTVAGCRDIPTIAPPARSTAMRFLPLSPNALRDTRLYFDRPTLATSSSCTRCMHTCIIALL